MALVNMPCEVMAAHDARVKGLTSENGSVRVAT